MGRLGHGGPPDADMNYYRWAMFIMLLLMAPQDHEPPAAAVSWPPEATVDLSGPEAAAAHRSRL